MAYREAEIGLLTRLDPVEAERQILEAYKASGCNLDEAAERLEVVSRTLRRLVVKLDCKHLMDRMKKQAIEEGWHHENSHQGGRKAG